jgi:TatD DNase family protein
MSDIFLVDTHAHICDPVFDIDRAEVLERARAAGLHAIVAVSENLKDAEINLRLAQQYRILLPGAGLAPSLADFAQAERVISFIRKEYRKIRAIGEVGLDYWRARDEEGRLVQREVFELFIECALELDLPLNVHSRSAGRQVIELLLKKGAKKVQLHAFDGRASSALPAVEAGFFFSIPPSVVRSAQKQKLIRSLPLGSLLIETDSPVLGPTAEKRNEPANATVSVDAIARIKGVEKGEILQAASRNAKRLYSIIPES